MSKVVLATGGAGFIGSHVIFELLEAGYEVVTLDNFENSDPSVFDRLSQLTGTEINFVEGDVRDSNVVKNILSFFGVDAVIHLAGKKAVGESVSTPLTYYDANLNGALSLLTAMKECNVCNLVFSSSATVYGIPDRLPIDETARTYATNPYGRTKLMIEEIISDVVASDENLQAISLRYFNPVGAHPSGLIGENPKGTPNNLFPYVAQTAAKQRPAVQVFGNDYHTPDGTGLRDYIHVSDLARGHVAALRHMLEDGLSDEHHLKINLGTGQGHTVLEVIRAFSQICGDSVPYQIVERRHGDVGSSLADPTLAAKLLGWRAEHNLNKMCRDHWRYQLTQMECDALTPLRPELRGSRQNSLEGTIH